LIKRTRKDWDPEVHFSPCTNQENPEDISIKNMINIKSITNQPEIQSKRICPKKIISIENLDILYNSSKRLEPQTQFRLLIKFIIKIVISKKVYNKYKLRLNKNKIKYTNKKLKV
jgi:hypothetical protein